MRCFLVLQCIIVSLFLSGCWKQKSDTQELKTSGGLIGVGLEGLVASLKQSIESRDSEALLALFYT